MRSHFPTPASLLQLSRGYYHHHQTNQNHSTLDEPGKLAHVPLFLWQELVPRHPGIGTLLPPGPVLSSPPCLPQTRVRLFFFKEWLNLFIYFLIKASIYSLMKVSHEQRCCFNIHPYYQALPLPVAAAVYQCSQVL